MKLKLSSENPEKNWKKRFYRLLTLSTVIFLCLVILLFQNFNYLAFKYFMSYFYIYNDSMDELYKKELKIDPKGSYSPSFDDFTIAAVTAKIRDFNKDRYTYLYIPEALEKYKLEEKDEASQSMIKVISDTIVYVKITNFSKYTDTFLKVKSKELSPYKNIIIDMRDNYGGDTEALYHMAQRFLPPGKVLAVDKLRLFSKTYKSKGSPDFHFDKIVILQNKNSASSAENFIVALKDNLTNVTLMGETTFGKGIGQFTLPLKNGYAVKATVMKWYTPSGKNIQGVGIAPDIKYTDSDIVSYAIKFITGENN